MARRKVGDHHETDGPCSRCGSSTRMPSCWVCAKSWEQLAARVAREQEREDERLGISGVPTNLEGRR
jgi:hypothetical protein